MDGWSNWGATSVGALLALVPSAQVMVGWSILWVYALSALLSVGAFVLAETAFVHGDFSRGKRILMVAAAGLLLVVSAYLFQPNTLCYLILFSAGMLDRCLRPWRESIGWIVRHALILGVSLIVAYVLIKILFASGVLHQSKRVAFEPDLIGKWFWFLHHVAPNALALFVVNDAFSRTTPYYEIAAVIMGLLLLTGAALVWRRRGPMAAWLSYGMLLPLGTAGYAINLIASERWSNYRTIYPLAGIVLVFVAFSFEKIARNSSVSLWLRHSFRAVIILSAALLARHQAYTLIAVPQEMELQRVTEESMKIVPGQHQRIYVITPTPKIAPAPLLYADELGSLSTDSTWVPKEMLRYILHERYPEIEKFESCEHMVSGAEEPPPGLYDVVLDLRLPRK
jgi:hypothetical protein